MMLASGSQYLKAYGLRQRMKAQAREGLTPWQNGFASLARPFLDGLIAGYEKQAGDAQRPGEWIPLMSGHRFWLEDPRPDEFEPWDIAYGLSRVPRYNGMTSFGPVLSVAQHSHLTSLLVGEEFALHALLHDAHEFVGMDVTSPLKRMLGDAYKPFELRLKAAVAERFGLDWTPEAEAAVKAVDNLLLAAEVDSVTPHRVIFGDLPAAPPPWGVQPLPWTAAMVQFSDRLNQLLGHVAVAVPDYLRSVAKAEQALWEDVLSGQIPE